MRFAKKILGVGLATALSRILGFVRDMLIGRILGAGRLSDIFLTAFKLPNLFRDLLGEGAMSSVFIPMFSREKKSASFASNAFSWLFLILLIITILMLIFMPLIMMGMAPGFDAEKLAMTVYIGRIMIGYIILVSVAGFLSAILNAFSDFWIAALSPTILNVALIFGLLTFGANVPALAVMVLLSGVIQILVLWRRLWQRNFGLRIIRPRVDPLIKTMKKRMSWGFFGTGFYQINVIVGVIIASFQTGAVSYLYYSDRLVQLPFAIIGLAMGTVILTKVSDAMAAGKMDLVYKYQNTAIRSSLMLTLPCMVGLIVLASPIVRVLFEHGEWTAAATSAVAVALMIQALSLPFMTTSQVYLKTLYASGDAKTPVKISAWTLLLSTVTMIALSGVFGYLAVPAGTLVGGIVRNFWLKRAAIHRNILTADFNGLAAGGVFLVLSLGMGAALYYVNNAGMAQGFFSLAIIIGLSAVIYLPIALFCDKIISKR